MLPLLLESQAYGYRPLKLHTFPEASVRIIHGGPGVYSTDPRRSHVEGDSFVFWPTCCSTTWAESYILLVSKGQSWIDETRRQCSKWKRGLSASLEPLFEFSARAFRETRPGPSPSVVVQLNESEKPVCSGLLPLKGTWGLVHYCQVLKTTIIYMGGKSKRPSPLKEERWRSK